MSHCLVSLSHYGLIITLIIVTHSVIVLSTFVTIPGTIPYGGLKDVRRLDPCDVGWRGLPKSGPST